MSWFHAIRRDIERNQTWYAIIGYTIVSGIIAGVRERSRVGRMIAATRADLDARSVEVTERMTRAVAEETNARVTTDWT